MKYQMRFTHVEAEPVEFMSDLIRVFFPDGGSVVIDKTALDRIAKLITDTEVSDDKAKKK